MEQTVKKRGWVKNAAIIFLSVMLVLTFFSNTILNRSLPEASTVLCMPGTIDSKVRISGTVSAKENYDVILEQTRKVLSVAVRQGDEVSTGDLLFTLEAGDSTELEQARDELHQAQINYQRALLNASTSDYSRENREIEQARAAVVKAQARADSLVVTREMYDDAQAKVDAAQAVVDEAQTKVDAAKAVVTEKKDAVAAAKEVLEAAKQATDGVSKELRTAQYGYNHSSDGADYNPPSLSGLQDQLTQAMNARIQADHDLQAAKSKYGDPAGGNGFKDFEDTALQNVSADTGIPLPGDYAAYLPFYPSVVVNDTRYLSAVDPDYTLPDGIVQRLPYYLEQLANEYASKTDGSPESLQREAYLAIRTATTDFLNAVNAENSARSALNDAANSGGSYDGPVSYDGKTHSYWEKEVMRLELALEDAQDKQNKAEAAVAAAETAVADASAAVTDAETGVSEAKDALDKAVAEKDGLKDKEKEHDAALEDVQRAQDTLADQIFNLEQQKKEDNKSAALVSLELQEQQAQIAKLQARVDELGGDVESVTEIRSKVNGTVKTLTVSAGHTAKAGDAVVQIEVSDLGYTMTASVTGDQARLLHVGDVANVNNYYWGNPTTAEITQIRPDPKNPQDGKIVTFSITGNVTAGSTLSFAIGEKNASYDYVVPNAAVRSDTNGQFLLIITAKNSPLGNRYIATRVPVEVVASDDLNSAVKGALEGHESVILTTSNNAPLKNGDQVRLPDVN